MRNEDRHNKKHAAKKAPVSLQNLDQIELKTKIQKLYLDAVMNMDVLKSMEYGGYTFYLKQRGSIPYAEVGLGLPREKPTKQNPIRNKPNYPNMNELQYFCNLLPYRQQNINSINIWTNITDKNWTIWATISTLQNN